MGLMLENQIERDLRNHYDILHSSIIGTQHRKATLIVQFNSDKTSMYVPVRDEIYIFVDGHSMDDRTNGLEGPHSHRHPGKSQWLRELLHEFTHEYQYKVLQGTVYPKGTDLHRRFGQHFPGVGHDADFYSAVATCAHKLGIPEDEYVNLI